MAVLSGIVGVELTLKGKAIPCFATDFLVDVLKASRPGDAFTINTSSRACEVRRQYGRSPWGPLTHPV